MKFSIIIPVYNVEKYIRKCLESVENQTYKNFEVIIINDGTKDNSQVIIDEFCSKYPESFKSFIKQNGGLSDARNYGIRQVTGDYIVFLDADDYLEIDFLEKVNLNLEKNKKLDLARVSINTVSEKGKLLNREILQEKQTSGEEIFIELRALRKCIEPAWSYVIRYNFWKENEFEFPKGKLHEDFATMLIVLLKAKKVSIIPNSYYNYVVRENSIMTNKNYENEVKKVNDKLEHYDNIIKQLEKLNDISEKAKEVCLEYISTAICMSLKKLKSNEKKNYKKELKKRNVIKNFKCNTIRNTLRKIVFTLIIFI